MNSIPFSGKYNKDNLGISKYCSLIFSFIFIFFALIELIELMKFLCDFIYDIISSSDLIKFKFSFFSLKSNKQISYFKLYKGIIFLNSFLLFAIKSSNVSL